MSNKNILVVIENGIIALDIRKQLTGFGFDTEVINPAVTQNIEEILKKGFHLMIMETRNDDKIIDDTVRLAGKYNLPTIYLSTENKPVFTGRNGFRILMMPFGQDDLKEVVTIALSEQSVTFPTSGE